MTNAKMEIVRFDAQDVMTASGTVRSFVSSFVFIPEKASFDMAYNLATYPIVNTNNTFRLCGSGSGDSWGDWYLLDHGTKTPNGNSGYDYVLYVIDELYVPVDGVDEKITSFDNVLSWIDAYVVAHPN